MNKHIALVHQSQETRNFFKKLLIESGYKTTEFNSELDILANISNTDIDLIICAFELTTIDGETFYKDICKEAPEMNFIFIGNNRDEDTITKILMLARCEYMVQPIVPVELLARIRALLVPINDTNDNNGKLIIKNLVLDANTKHAKRGKRDIVLTPTEFSLLQYLMENAGTVLSREMILNKVWKTTEHVSDRVVDVYIGYLREKIDQDSKEKLLETVTGFGYKISK